MAAAPPHQADVVVVGAGVAGLTAAAALRERGLKVVVLEGRRRLGGRVHSQPLGPAGVPVDNGASWLHRAGDDPAHPTRRLALAQVGSFQLPPLDPSVPFRFGNYFFSEARSDAPGPNPARAAGPAAGADRLGDNGRLRRRGARARRRGGARARLHCRFVPPLIHFIPDSLTYSVPLFLKRQCDRTLGGGGGGRDVGGAEAREGRPAGAAGAAGVIYAPLCIFP
jgi:phytoene dehydrogenase-like protein